jgi:hypothetical protein
MSRANLIHHGRVAGKPAVAGTADTIVPNGGTHDGQFVQNCFLNEVRWAFSHGDYQHFSKSAGLAPWSTGGNFSNLYSSLGGSAAGKGQVVEDCTLAHGGWRNGAARNDAISAGGVAGNVLAHLDYYSVDNLYGVRRRITYVDAPIDGRNYRGDLSIAEDLVSWDDPFAGFLSGAVGTWTDNADGSKIVGARWLTMGNSYRGGPNSTDRSVGGFNVSQAQNGTIIDRGWMFDAVVNDSGVPLIGMGAADPAQIDSYITLNNFKIRNYPDQKFQFTGYDGVEGSSGVAKLHATISNSITDHAITGTSQLTVSGNSTWGGSPPTVTRALVVGDIGFVNANYNIQKATALNAVIMYAHLNWPRAIIGAAATRFGDTPSHSWAIPPFPTSAGFRHLERSTAPALRLSVSAARPLPPA